MSLRRLLLYANTNSSSNETFNFDGNITLDCIFNCIGVCLSGVCIPFPPISPISFPRNDNSSDSSTAINFHHRDRLTPSLIIAVVAAVAGSFALLLTLYAYLRFRRRARRNNLRRGSESAPDVVNENDDEIGGDLPPGDEIDHHIWYIRTQGLEDSTISSITSWIYKSSDGIIDSKDCSVCLGEFNDGELVRLLPKCSHAFHLPCIDRWLRSHVNCPLCRAPIVSALNCNVQATSPASPPTAVDSDPVESVIGSVVPLETLENDSEEIEIGIVVQSSEASSSRHLNSQVSANLLEEDDYLQPIRRSVSMDTFYLDVNVINGGGEEEGIAFSHRKKTRGSLKGKFSGKLHTKMDGSLSSQSSRWFFPRYGRPRNSVLPL